MIVSPAKAVSLGLGLVVLALGVPQAADSVIRLYADSLVDPDAPPRPDLQAEAASAATLLVTVDRWFGDPEARAKAGLLEERFAASGSSAAPNIPEDQQAAADLAAAVAEAPGDAKAWTELAQSRVALSDVDGAKRAWRTSILAAGYDPGLVFERVLVGLELLLVLNEADRQLLNEQIAYAWDADPDELVALAKKASFTANLIEQAFADDPNRLMPFEWAFARR
jgi:hypothetical protein